MDREKVKKIDLVERAPTVAEYQMLRESAGWYRAADDPTHEGLRRALFSLVAEAEGVAVGCGRVVGDGGLYFYIQDIIVLPAFRGMGIGGMIMDRVMAYLDDTVRPNAFVGLMAARGVAGLYEKYGFEKRPAEGPGMFRVWGR